MKRLIICITLLGIVSILGSCQKFVDIQQGDNKTFITTAKDCQLLLDNYTMNTGGLSDGEVSADDYYLTKTGYLAASVTPEDRGFYTWSKDAIRSNAAASWKNLYYNVYYTNLILEAGDKLKSSGTDQGTMNTIRGSALFLRSFYFWQLAQLYAKPYVAGTATQDPGIPLRLTSDINDESVRGTVAGTYGQITKDLEEAISLLPVQSTVATRPNKVAAYALLARVYLSMDNYSAALASSNGALQLNSNLIDYNTLNASSPAPFFPRFNKEVLFHFVMSDAQTLRQNVARIDPNLVASYAANDLRSTVFLQQESINGQPDGKRFKGNYEPSVVSNFFNGIALDEVFLTRAECYARTGNASAAMADLNTLLRTRWKTNTYVNMTASDADDALIKILTERRKELVMRGLRWTDLRRLNKESRFAKTLTRVVDGQGTFTLPPNDARYVLLIPQQVIDNSNIPQNVR